MLLTSPEDLAYQRGLNDGSRMAVLPPIVSEVLAEVRRAMAKFPTWPTDPLHALAVLGEEFGELTKEVVQFTYEPHKSSGGDVRKEAIQTAAMALRFILGLDEYHFERGYQHTQEPLL